MMAPGESSAEQQPVVESGGRPTASHFAGAALKHKIIADCSELTMQDLTCTINGRPILLTDSSPTWLRGSRNDYHSEADYWWPGQTASAPYEHHDGCSNPNIFNWHRMALRELKYRVSLLVCARIDLGLREAEDALVEQINGFFVDPKTRMTPHLRFAQGIKGRCPGRAAGLIDGIHLAEVALALRRAGYALQRTRVFQNCILWFRRYYRFLTTSSWGKEESGRRNNHATAYWLQRLCIAHLLKDYDCVISAKNWVRRHLLRIQMDPIGSFSAELKRTRPYAYSLFQVNCLTLLLQAMTIAGDNSAWNIKLPDGRCAHRAVEWIYPYIITPRSWPYNRDVEHYNRWNVRHPALYFAGVAYRYAQYLQTFKGAQSVIDNEEVDRNMPALILMHWLP